MHYYFALLGFTFPDILYLICTQTTQQEPGNPHKCWISELHFLFKLNSDTYILWFVTSSKQVFCIFKLFVPVIFCLHFANNSLLFLLYFLQFVQQWKLNIPSWTNFELIIFISSWKSPYFSVFYIKHLD